MNGLIVNHGLSQRRACRLLAFDRSVGRYKHKMTCDIEAKAKIISIAHERRRFGYLRICILLKREGLKINHKMEDGFPGIKLFLQALSWVVYSFINKR